MLNFYLADSDLCLMICRGSTYQVTHTSGQEKAVRIASKTLVLTQQTTGHVIDIGESLPAYRWVEYNRMGN
jgi:hypothetical protein